MVPLVPFIGEICTWCRILNSNDLKKDIDTHIDFFLFVWCQSTLHSSSLMFKSSSFSPYLAFWDLFDVFRLLQAQLYKRRIIFDPFCYKTEMVARPPFELRSWSFDIFNLAFLLFHIKSLNKLLSNFWALFDINERIIWRGYSNLSMSLILVIDIS